MVPVGATVLCGWAAAIGDLSPRSILLRIEDSEFDLVANGHRDDLARNGINQGDHAFTFSVPLRFVDGHARTVTLIDRLSGKTLAQATCAWQINRSFTDFAGMLRDSVVSPLITAPFREEDKRVFAVMDQLGGTLAIEGLRAVADIKVSVIMPVRDRAATVMAAIESVLAQTYAHFELLIVDDGSVDSTLSVLESVGDDRVRVMRFEQGQGVSAARNAALGQASGQVVAYLDSDNTWDERYLAAMVGVHLREPGACGWYCAQSLYRGEQTRPFAIRFGAFNPALLANRNYIDLNAFCHTRAVLDRVGGFDQALRRFVDWDLIRRIAEHGRVCSVPMLLSRYAFDRSDNTLTGQSEFLPDLELVRESAAIRARLAQRAKVLPVQLKRRVTVVIPSFGAFDDLQRGLSRLFDLPYARDLDIVVVDNGSSPDIVAYLRTCAAQGRLRLICNAFNLGFTYAVNQGLAVADINTDVLLLNNDAIVAPDAIPHLQDASLTLAECGAVVPQQVLPGGTDTIELHVPSADATQACDVNLSAHHRNVVAVPLIHDGKVVELSFAPFFAVYLPRRTLDEAPMLNAELGRHYRSDRMYCDYLRNVMNRRIYYLFDAVVQHKLQQATNEWMSAGDTSGGSDAIAQLNTWSPELREALGFRQLDWDDQATQQ